MFLCPLHLYYKEKQSGMKPSWFYKVRFLMILLNIKLIVWNQRFACNKKNCYSINGSIRRAIDFHGWPKFYEVKFFISKMFLTMVKNILTATQFAQCPAFYQTPDRMRGTWGDKGQGGAWKEYLTCCYWPVCTEIYRQEIWRVSISFST